MTQGDKPPFSPPPAPAASLVFTFGTPHSSDERGVIYTFYSFKGGVGRSMALANVAALLAKWGYSVLVVDWDVEAPGIERFFARDNPEIHEFRANRPGIVELVQANSDGDPLSWRDCLIDVKIGPNSSRLSLLTAGRSGEDYTSRLHALNFPELFEKHDLGSYIEELRNEWAGEFQFVLVDSRTGVTDIGGICTVHLADVLVLLFTTTDSSTDGALQILKRARKAQERLPRDRKRLFAVPVPSRDESRTEYEKAAQWKDRFAEQFGEVYRDWLPSGIQPREAIEKLRIPYVPYWSFGEQLPAIEEGTSDPGSLGYSYQMLARILMARLDWYKALEGQELAPPLVAKAHQPDPDWLTRHAWDARKHLSDAGLPGFMEVLHFSPDSQIEKNQRELLSAAKQAQVALTGWPIGLVLENNDELRPRSTSEGILAIVDANVRSSVYPRRTFDYWALSKSGDFYTLRSLTEDQLDEDRARKILCFDDRIRQATEALRHCGNLHKSLGTDPNSQVELGIRYGGLRDRELTSHNSKWIYHGKNVHDSEVSIEPIRFRLGAIEAEIVALVKKICAPLFMIFDYTEIPDDVYEQIIADLINGRR